MGGSFSLSAQDIVGFIPTVDAERARVFYRDTLGLPLVSDELPFALVFDANGAMLRVTVVPHLTPAPHTILGWKVADIASAAKALAEAGVQFERYPWMAQDELGIWASPSGTKVTWFKDPDGNTLSISQH
jgi:catechol 2,3-dioxygenase-like lactoylglutathione lyase family enzyme